MASNTREKIIDTIISLYGRHSYEEISTKQITEEVGISKGTLYWHFASKEDMFKEAFDRCYQKLVECSRMDIDENASGLDCLKRRLKNMVVFNKNDPDCMRFLIKHMPLMAKQLEIQDEAFPFKKELYTDVLKYLQKGLSSKEIVDLPLDFLCYFVLYPITGGLTTYLNRDPQHYENESLIDKMIDSIFNAIKATAAS